ncbi:asparagine synthase-related protein [uncultured Thiohalocapsa sp.]|uniref:asparagine synthase-related protein n=1 Tax=uncultured Thiohalocapsa sp. TaxID=768990 RepID=UPI0025F5C854|nr:asparagine synthase-related protein [uncultured Thiohalocapsa sp.]
MNALLGAAGLGTGELARLADWAEHRGGLALHPPGAGQHPPGAAQHPPGAAQHPSGAFALWRFGTPLGGLRSLRADGVQAWLLGDLFPSPPPGAGMQADGTPPDAMLDAYRRHGHGWVWSLAGQLALVLWDAARGELALYRDDSSAQTLYYHRLPGDALVFSDRLDALVHCPLVQRRLSPDGLHEYLRLLDITSPNTIYAGVQSTEPGVLCLYGRHGLHQRRPETTAPAPAAPDGGSAPGLDAAAAALDELLAQAVAERTADTTAPVCFLSGGVDSAYLCALAAAQRLDVTALTVGFAEPGADESAVAAAVAGSLGVRHRVLRFSTAEYQRAFAALAGAEYPFADPAGAPTLLAFEQARNSGDIALDGTGADTLLGIMPARHQRLAVQYAARLPRPLRRALAGALAPLPRLRNYRPLMDFGDPEEVLMRWGGWSRRELERLCGRPVDLSGSRFYQVFRSFAPGAHMACYSALMGTLPDDRIHVAAGLTGLRVRFPFFADGVGNYVQGLPVALRWAPGETKRVLKHALAQRVPRALWDVPKHGFDFPFDSLLTADDHALLRAHTDAATLARLGCADTAALARTVAAYRAGSRAQRFRVWALAVLGAWLQQHDLSA